MSIRNAIARLFGSKLVGAEIARKAKKKDKKKNKGVIKKRKDILNELADQ